MKRWTFRILALAWLAGTALQAQNITGTWQGSLRAGARELRIVYKFSLEDNKVKAVMYSIDQPGPPIPVSAITRDGSAIKMSINAIGGTYEGKLSADAKSIAGTWTQGPPQALNLVRATPETAWTIPDPPPPPKIMAADPNPVFEVATIKPSRPEERLSILVNRSGILNTTHTSVNDLLKFAYDLHPQQIKGPEWLDSEKYDVTAKPDLEGVPSIGQMKIMIQKLMQDRFQLTFHREKRDLSVYAIVVGKSGPKLSKNDGSPAGLPGFGRGGLGTLNVRNSTMAEFANMMQANILDRPAVDQSGLGATRYDFILKWTPDPAPTQTGAGPNPPVADNPDAAPDIFIAFEQQLGLKLESTKAPVDVLVIDNVQKPSGN